MAIQLHSGESHSRKPGGDRGPKAPGRLKGAGLLLRDSAKEWSADGASHHAAALSFYTLFSLSPLLVVAIGVAGLLYGQEAAREGALQYLTRMMGPQASASVKTMLDHSLTRQGGMLATALGLLGVVLGASGVFGHLQAALNTLWKVKPGAGRGLKGVLRDRLLSFGLVVFVGVLLLGSLAAATALSAMGETLTRYLPFSSVTLQAFNFGVSLCLTALLFAVVFKALPDASMRWRDLWVGAFATAFLFSIGRFLIGMYLARGGVSSPYGAAGSLVLLLLWIYYSSQVLFFGAELTRMYAERFGAGVVPRRGAERVGYPGGHPTITR